MANIKIYLDNCVYNRPFDDQDSILIRLESEAKLFIQEQIRDRRVDLIWSSINSYENNDNPSPEKRERILDQRDIAVQQCSLNNAILKKALELELNNFRAKDALHVAAAVFSKCDYFITTDKKILNKKISEIIILNPIVFVEEYLK